MSQIVNLTLLAPDIQEAILFMPRVEIGRDKLTLRNLHSITLQSNWQKQRNAWEKLRMGI